jgi:hypothetical protein
VACDDASGAETWLAILREAEPPMWIRQGQDRGKWVLTRCRCGVEKVLRLRSVMTGAIRSCGCMGRAARHLTNHRWQKQVREDIERRKQEQESARSDTDED